MSTKERIDGVISEQVLLDPRSEWNNPSLKLEDDLGVDSLDMVNIFEELEDEFGIEIDDEEWDEVKTVGDVYECVKRKLREEG